MYSNSLFYNVVGEGKPLIFLHGWEMDGSSFLPFANRIRGFKCYLLDLWGFGKSEAPNSAWSVEDYADRLYMFIKSENLTKVSIVGHSFGGRIAVVFGAKYKDSIDKIVLIDSAGLRRFSLTRFFKVAKYKLQKAFKKVGIVNSVKSSPSSDYAKCSNKLLPTFIKVVNQDLSTYARKITVETLIIWGKSDKETPLWMARRYNKLIKHSALVLLDGGHFAFWQNVNNSLILESFL